MKIRVQKFQLGGEFASLAVNYIPTSASTTAGAYAPAVASSLEGSGRSSSKSSEKDELSIKDVLKVFDNVKGLPIDVQYVLKDFKQMFEDDTLFSFSGKPSYSSLVSYYLNNIGKFNMLAQSKEHYEEARKELVANNSLDEIAVDRNGRIVVSNGEDIDVITLDEFKKGDYIALTNRELLNLRQTKLPFGDSIYNTMTGVGMDQIIKKVNSIVQSLGSTERKVEGYTVKQSDAIKAGLNTLQEAPSGLYKTSELTKDQKEQAELALSAVFNSLTPQERTLLTIHSKNSNNPKEILSDLIYSRTSLTNEVKFDYQENLNPDGTKKSEKEAKDIDDIKDNVLLQIQSGIGGEVVDMVWRTKYGMDSMGTKGRRYTVLPKDSGPTSLENMLRESGIGGILQSYEGITFGDQPISPDSLKDIMYDGRGGMVAFLPAVTDELGNRRVDLSVLEEYKQITNSVQEEINSPAWQREVANKMKEAGLDQYLTYDDKLDSRRFGLFLMIDGVTTDRIFKGNKMFEQSNFLYKESNPDSGLVDQLQMALSTDKDRSNYEIDPLDKWTFIDALNGGWDDIYRGTVYLPLSTNQISGAMFGGTDITRKQGMEMDTNYLNHQSEKFNSFKQVGSEILLQ